MKRSKTHFKNTHAGIRTSQVKDGGLSAKQQAIKDMGEENDIFFPTIVNSENLIRSIANIPPMIILTDQL